MPPSPPGPYFQHLNAISHREPLATILHLVFLIPILAFATPVGIVGLLLYGAFRIHLSRLPPHVPTKLMAVVITGCDTGIGRELALVAADAGYTVFAGCLSPATAWPGALNPRLIPLAMDVTIDAQVKEAVHVVEKWLSEDDTHVLHALVNNAGVGGIGLIDWMDMKFYELCMNVNFFGLVRCCKAFLPIFKKQVNRNCRIINLTSLAGLVHGHQTWSAYAASKHAANAFSHTLRAECRLYCQVTTVNPSFHATAIVHNLKDLAQNVWAKVDDETKKQYGESFFESVYEYCYERPYRLAWDLQVPVEQLALLLSRQYLLPEVYVGADARFLFGPMLALPLWISEHLVRLGNLGMRDPAFVVAAKKAKPSQ